MANRKPKNTASENNLEEQNTPSDSNIKEPIIFQDDKTMPLKVDKGDGYLIQEVMDEYRLLNESFIKVIDKLLYIFNNAVVTDADISFIESIDFIYEKREIKRSEKYFSDKNLFRNILEATLSDSILKAKEFFGDANADWDAKADKYDSLIIIKASSIYSIVN